MANEVYGSPYSVESAAPEAMGRVIQFERDTQQDLPEVKSQHLQWNELNWVTGSDDGIDYPGAKELKKVFDERYVWNPRLSSAANRLIVNRRVRVNTVEENPSQRTA